MGCSRSDELKTFMEREGSKLPKPPAEAIPTSASGNYYYYNNPEGTPAPDPRPPGSLRLGRYSEARPWFDKETLPFLDEFIAQFERAKRKDASKGRAARRVLEGGQSHGPARGAARGLFRPGEHGSAGERAPGGHGKLPGIFHQIRQGPPLRSAARETRTATAEGECQTRTARHYSKLHRGADLGMRSAALMPDNEDATALRLNTIGLWLKMATMLRRDRIYQGDRAPLCQNRFRQSRDQTSLVRPRRRGAGGRQVRFPLPQVAELNLRTAERDRVLVSLSPCLLVCRCLASPTWRIRAFASRKSFIFSRAV